MLGVVSHVTLISGGQHHGLKFIFENGLGSWVYEVV